MKTKLRYLFVVSIISLSCVSKISMLYADSFVTKGSTYPTTSASGFDEGPITQKDHNGEAHLEKYDPQKHEKQLFLDLTHDMELLSSGKAKVTVKNVSNREYQNLTLFYIKFLFVSESDLSEVWYIAKPVPLPGLQYSFELAIPCIDCVAPWRLWAWANMDVQILPEQNYDNNLGIICRYDEDCP